MLRAMSEVGNISPELDAVKIAYRLFQSAVEGPYSSSELLRILGVTGYASDEEAYTALDNTGIELRDAVVALLRRLRKRGD